MPVYFGILSTVFSLLYLYVFVPLTVIVASYVLIIYSINTIKDGTIPETRIRRGVATLFPFLASLYAVVTSEVYEIKSLLNLPFYVLLLAGLLIGYLFIFWISRIKDDDDEFVPTLSCFVASTIFFAMLTIFVITRSFEVISFVFGFLFGICIYVIRNGFSILKRFRAPFRNPFSRKPKQP